MGPRWVHRDWNIGRDYKISCRGRERGKVRWEKRGGKEGRREMERGGRKGGEGKLYARAPHKLTCYKNELLQKFIACCYNSIVNLTANFCMFCIKF